MLLFVYVDPLLHAHCHGHKLMIMDQKATPEASSTIGVFCISTVFNLCLVCTPIGGLPMGMGGFVVAMGKITCWCA